MSAGYRDELEAALAANESLRSENTELRQELERREQALQQLQQQFQQQMSRNPRAEPPRNTPVIMALGAVLVIMMAGAAMFFILGRSRSTTSYTPPAELYPTPPTGLRPNGEPWTNPAQPQPPAELAPSNPATPTLPTIR